MIDAGIGLHSFIVHGCTFSCNLYPIPMKIVSLYCFVALYFLDWNICTVIYWLFTKVMQGSNLCETFC